MKKSYKSRRERGERLRRIGIWGGLLFLLAVSESSFFGGLSFLPATPDLILCAVVAIALLDSPAVAAVAAVGGGVLSDVMGGTGAYFSPILYLLTVLLLSGMAEKMMPRIWSWALMMLPALLLRGAATLLGLVVSRGSAPLGAALWQVILPEAAISFLLGIPLYFIASLCEKFCGERRSSAL